VKVSMHVEGTAGNVLRDAAHFLAEHVCDHQLDADQHRSEQLVLELLHRTAGSCALPATAALSCDGEELTAWVDLPPVPVDRHASVSTPDLENLQDLADDWGAECLRPGVRYWATVVQPHPA
jgi:hypothetical protein